MKAEELVRQWFELWENGEFQKLPLSENFRHTSPYGTISGRKAYLDLVKANTEKFLGHQFKIHDSLFGHERACIRYTAIKEDFSLDVSEWHYIKEDLIEEIVAYYNIPGEIQEERKLEIPQH